MIAALRWLQEGGWTALVVVGLAALAAFAGIVHVLAAARRSLLFLAAVLVATLATGFFGARAERAKVEDAVHAARAEERPALLAFGLDEASRPLRLALVVYVGGVALLVAGEIRRARRASVGRRRE